MKRWSLVIAALIWIGLGVLLSWVNGVAEHKGAHETPGEVHGQNVVSQH